MLKTEEIKHQLTTNTIAKDFEDYELYDGIERKQTCNVK